jgi:hypothetical protein
MRTTLALFVVALVVAGAALGAAPTKGGKYVGTLYKGKVNPVTKLFENNPAGWEKPFTLTVAKSGQTARLLWWCGHVRNINYRQSASFPIAADGSFAFRNGSGTYTVWAVKGRFVSADTARVAFTVPSTCDGKGGTVILKIGGS